MSDNNYWEKRAVDLEKLTQDRADVDVMHVNKLFDGAIEIIEKQIDEIFDKYARDSGLTQDSALKLLNEKQTDTLRRNLMTTLAQCQEEVARQAILARLNAPAYAARISRLEALKDLVYSQAYMVGADAHRRLENRLIDTYEQSYYRNIYDMQRRIESGFDFTKLADRDVQAAIETEWAGSNYSKRIWKNTDMLAKSLEQVITQGLMTGQSIRNMDLALEAKIDGGRYNINRVIRTEVNHCCNQGTLMSYKAAGTLRYIYLATLDMRTSSICRSLDKEVFFVSKAEVGVNFPPMHPNCRSTTMAYPEDGIFPKERTARDQETNKNIHVPFEMSYAQWYRKYVLEKKDNNSSLENKPENDIIKMNLQFFADKSRHAEDREAERNISEAAIQDALQNPLFKGEVVMDEYGRKSIKYIGREATVIMNPDTNTEITTWKTGSRIRKKYEGGD
jgi:SPP1 gp7 family putative phage head morphogenesis protein